SGCPLQGVVVPLPGDAVALPCSRRSQTIRRGLLTALRRPLTRSRDRLPLRVLPAANARLTFPRAARADETNELFARGQLAFSDFSQLSAPPSNTRDDGATGSASRVVATGHCSARTADHEVDTDHFSRGSTNDSNSFTKRAAAYRHNLRPIANRHSRPPLRCPDCVFDEITGMLSAFATLRARQ